MCIHVPRCKDGTFFTACENYAHAHGHSAKANGQFKDHAIIGPIVNAVNKIRALTEDDTSMLLSSLHFLLCVGIIDDFLDNFWRSF